MWWCHQYLNFIPTDVLLWHPMFFLISQRSAFVSKKCYSTWNASRHSTAGRWRGLKNSPLISSGRAGTFELSSISAACLSFSCAFNNRFSAIMPSSSLNSTDQKSNSDRMSSMCFLRHLLYRTSLRACGVASTPQNFHNRIIWFRRLMKYWSKRFGYFISHGGIELGCIISKVMPHSTADIIRDVQSEYLIEMLYCSCNYCWY